MKFKMIHENLTNEFKQSIRFYNEALIYTNR